MSTTKQYQVQSNVTRKAQIVLAGSTLELTEAEAQHMLAHGLIKEVPEASAPVTAPDPKPETGGKKKPETKPKPETETK